MTAALSLGCSRSVRASSLLKWRQITRPLPYRLEPCATSNKIAGMTPQTLDIRLEPLSDEEYREFVERQLIETARQRELAGESEPSAYSRQGLDGLVNDTLRGAGHEFLK